MLEFLHRGNLLLTLNLVDLRLADVGVCPSFCGLPAHGLLGTCLSDFWITRFEIPTHLAHPKAFCEEMSDAFKQSFLRMVTLL